MLAMQSKSYIPAVWRMGARERLDSRLTTAFVMISWLKYRVFNYFRSNEFWRLAQYDHFSPKKCPISRQPS